MDRAITGSMNKSTHKYIIAISYEKSYEVLSCKQYKPSNVYFRFKMCWPYTLKSGQYISFLSGQSENYLYVYYDMATS